MLVFTQKQSKFPWLMFKKFGAWIFFILIGFLQLYMYVHTTRNVYNTKRWMSGIKKIKIYYHAVRLYIINIFYSQNYSIMRPIFPCALIRTYNYYQLTAKTHSNCTCTYSKFGRQTPISFSQKWFKIIKR